MQAISMKDLGATTRLFQSWKHAKHARNIIFLELFWDADEHFRIGKREPPTKPKMDWELVGKSLLFVWKKKMPKPPWTEDLPDPPPTTVNSRHPGMGVKAGQAQG